MKKKIVRYLLVLALTVTMLPAFSVQADAVTSITEETVISRLNSAESVWKNGAVFNDSKTLAKSCFGFGRELFHYVFNDSLPARWSTVTARFDVQQYMNNVTEIQHLSKGYTLDELKSLLAKAKPGDFLIAASGRNHGVIIRSAAADGSSIRVYDANWNGKNGIRTNAVWTAADMRRQRPIAVTLYRYAGYVENVSTIGMATVEHTHQGGAFQFYETVHPHRNYYKCAVCGENYTDGSTAYVASCETCNPSQPEPAPTPTHDTHVKGAFQFSEAVHPHRNYYKCSVCGENFTDGTTAYLDSCQTCNPVKEEIWLDWSDWSAAPAYASDTRQVETRTVKVSEAYTQYRYGRYVANGHDCWCSLYLEGLGYGRASLDVTDWSSTQYGTSGRDWSCGYCRGSHAGYDHFSSDGRPWWKEYKSPSGQSYYWEESRTVPAVYETQYRYRDRIN